MIAAGQNLTLNGTGAVVLIPIDEQGKELAPITINLAGAVQKVSDTALAPTTSGWGQIIGFRVVSTPVSVYHNWSGGTNNPSTAGYGELLSAGKKIIPAVEGVTNTPFDSAAEAAVAFDPLDRSKKWLRAAIFGDSIALGSGVKYNDTDESTIGVGLGALLPYAISCEGFVITHSQAISGSRILTASGGTAPGLDTQVTNALLVDNKFDVAFIKSITNDIAGSFALSQAATEALVTANYETAIAPLRAAGIKIVHIIPPLRQNGGTNAEKLSEYNQCVWIRNKMYALYEGVEPIIDLFEVTARKSSVAADPVPYIWQDGMTSDSIHPTIGGAGQAMRRAVRKGVATSALVAIWRDTLGVVLPTESGESFVQGYWDGLTAFPTAGASDWNTSGTAPSATALALTTDPDEIPGFEITCTAAAATSYYTCLLNSLLTVGSWYVWTCKHELISTTLTTANIAIRIVYTSDGKRMELLSNAFFVSVGPNRTAVAFKVPSGSNSPQVQIGLVSAATVTAVLRVWDIGVYAVDW